MELQAMLVKWEADEGDPKLVEHRTKELVRLRLARLNDCHY